MATKYIVSLRDIASDTGVSISTVSRVLRQKGETSEKTRDRILEAADRLGYKDNLLVQGIRTGRTRTVGVSMRPDHPFYTEVFAGIHDALVAADYAPIVLWSQDHGETELEQLHRFVERRVEGVIIRARQHDAANSYFHDLIERGLPVVLIDSDLFHANLPFVGTDDRAGARLAAEHLIARGHTRIGQIAAATDFTSTGHDRMIGFQEAVAAHPGVHCETIEQEQFAADPEVALALLRREPRPTAIFTANDDIAVGVYDAAAELGLRIPDDLAVIGFADLPLARILRPRLTTIHQRPFEIGRRAVEELLKLLDESATPPAGVPKIRIPSELIVREST